MRWDDWAAAADAAYERLRERVDGHVLVGGQSMGGTLTTWLAARHPEISGIICINPLVAGVGQLRDILQAGIDMGQEMMAGIGSDIADPDAKELAYPDTPLRALLSLFDALEDLQVLLPDVTCPALVITSRQDHVVPPFNSDHLADTMSGPVERLWLERSYHVATLDFDRDEIETRALDFAAKVVAG